MAHPVADHAEHRRDQGPDELQRRKHGEQQHGARLDHDVPAEHQRLHFERPRGEQIGRPLEAIIADAEWRECGRSCGCAQDAMTGFTAIPPYSCSSVGRVAPAMPLSIGATACRHACRRFAVRQCARSIASSPSRYGEVDQPPLALAVRRAHACQVPGPIRQVQERAPSRLPRGPDP